MLGSGEALLICFPINIQLGAMFRIAYVTTCTCVFAFYIY